MLLNCGVGEDSFFFLMINLENIYFLPSGEDSWESPVLQGDQKKS